MPDFPPLLSASYSERLTLRNESSFPEIWQILDQVKDPEIPVLSIWDLGILTDITQLENELIVTITPTYSGCPAMDMLRQDIHSLLTAAGYKNVSVQLKLAPAWTTDWMSPDGRNKLQQYGIAPPEHCKADGCLTIRCPHCSSLNTKTISEFGSTACKALYQCQDCLEPFDYFKNI